MNHIDIGHHLKELTGNVAGRSDARRCHADLVWIGFGVSNELGNCLGRKGWIYLKDKGRANEARNGRDVANKVVSHARREPIQIIPTGAALGATVKGVDLRD